MFCLRKKAVTINSLVEVFLLFSRLIDRFRTSTSSLHRTQLKALNISALARAILCPRVCWRPGATRASARSVRGCSTDSMSTRQISALPRVSKIFPRAKKCVSRIANGEGLLLESPLISRMMFFSSCHECGTKKKFWVFTRNRTSDLRIPRSDALPLSHRDSTVARRGEVCYEVENSSYILKHFEDMNR